jgi:hypothetical protein
MKSNRHVLLRTAGLIGVFLLAWAITGFIPAFPLYQGRAMIGRIPLFAA